MTFNSFVAGGKGEDSYTYSWSGAVSGSGDSVTETFEDLGSYTATVTVTSGKQTVSDSASVEVIEIPEDWDLEIWKRYQVYGRLRAQELIAQAEPIDCADFALEIYINFCEANGLPIEFEVWNASENEWMAIRREDFNKLKLRLHQPKLRINIF